MIKNGLNLEFHPQSLIRFLYSFKTSNHEANFNHYSSGIES